MDRGCRVAWMGGLDGGSESHIGSRVTAELCSAPKHRQPLLPDRPNTRSIAQPHAQRHARACMHTQLQPRPPAHLHDDRQRPQPRQCGTHGAVVPGLPGRPDAPMAEQHHGGIRRTGGQPRRHVHVHHAARGSFRTARRGVADRPVDSGFAAPAVVLLCGLLRLRLRGRGARGGAVPGWQAPVQGERARCVPVGWGRAF